MSSQSVFLKIFGDSPILKVIDFLTINDDFDYSMTDIAREAGVGYATLKYFWSDLESQGFVKQVRIIGRAKMYKLNNQNPLVRKFKSFYWETTKFNIRKNVVKKKLVV